MTIYQLRATLAEEVVLLQESNTETDERMFMVLLRRLSRDNYIEWKWSDDIWDIKSQSLQVSNSRESVHGITPYIHTGIRDGTARQYKDRLQTYGTVKDEPVIMELQQ